MPVQLSSQKEATHLRTFQRSKRQKWCILSQVPRASRWPSRQRKSPMFKSCTIKWILVHKGPKHLGSSFVIPHCEPRRPPFGTFRVFHWADAPSETLTEWSPHHPHLLLTNQHKNADVSFIDLRSYIPEISWVRSSKLPPLLRGGDNT